MKLRPSPLLRYARLSQDPAKPGEAGPQRAARSFPGDGVAAALVKGGGEAAGGGDQS